MEFDIVKGVPLPRGKGKPRKYDLKLEEMEVEDHVFVPIPKAKIKQEVRIIRNFVLRFTHKHNDKEFTVRQMDNGVGIWRIG
mgnify:CR=1 FL=1|jgi:hypothetical protein